jgi:hypothetical protein
LLTVLFLLGWLRSRGRRHQSPGEISEAQS